MKRIEFKQKLTELVRDYVIDHHEIKSISSEIETRLRKIDREDRYRLGEIGDKVLTELFCQFIKEEMRPEIESAIRERIKIVLSESDFIDKIGKIAMQTIENSFDRRF